MALIAPSKLDRTPLPWGGDRSTSASTSVTIDSSGATEFRPLAGPDSTSRRVRYRADEPMLLGYGRSSSGSDDDSVREWPWALDRDTGGIVGAGNGIIFGVDGLWPALSIRLPLLPAVYSVAAVSPALDKWILTLEGSDQRHRQPATHRQCARSL